MGAVLIGGYLRLIRLTSRIDLRSAGLLGRGPRPSAPFIAASWHGQSNLAYVLHAASGDAWRC